MKTVLNLGFDLGSDSLKIAYAYCDPTDQDENVKYGKLAGGDGAFVVALPAVAYYRSATRQWLYADEVERSGERSFISIVKIKSLISLLAYHADEEIRQSNRAYYFNNNLFPKFYFPVRRKALDHFADMEKSDRAFVAPGKSPRGVCLGFFRYVKSIVDRDVAELGRRTGTEFDELKITVVHPPNVGKEYLKELSSLIEAAFSQAPWKAISSTKALGMYAYYRKAVAQRESFLVFDLGEECVSVAKASFLDGNIVVDGVEGHNLPCEIGGLDVDEAVVRFLETEIRACETIGTPSYGEDGHIQENGLHAKQYLLMKDIKKAKTILARNPDANSVFADGVPIALSRDVYVQRVLTKERFRACIGVSDNTGIAKLIADYVEDEVRRPLNRGVKSVFLSGGLAQTYSLVEFIRDRLSVTVSGVQIKTFGDGCEDKDAFRIRSYEDSVYASALGAAIVAMENYDVKTILSLSYGTWSTDRRDHTTKALSLFVNRGQPLDPAAANLIVRARGENPFVGATGEKGVYCDGAYYFMKMFSAGSRGVPGEEIYSTVLTEEEASRCNLPHDSDGRVVIGSADSVYRRNAEQTIALKVVAGGEKRMSGEAGEVRFFYCGKRVVLRPGFRIQFMEGIKVDENGAATPFVVNNSAPDSVVDVDYLSEHDGRTIGSDASILARLIELRLFNVKGFVVISG